MPSVVLVCVSDDLPQAEALADMFDIAGYAVDDGIFDDATLHQAAAAILVLSPAAIVSDKFRDAAQRALDTGKAVIASLENARLSHFGAAPVFDLSDWYGEPKDRLLDPLFFAVERLRIGASVRAHRQPAPADDRVIASVAAE